MELSSNRAIKTFGWLETAKPFAHIKKQKSGFSLVEQPALLPGQSF